LYRLVFIVLLPEQYSYFLAIINKLDELSLNDRQHILHLLRIMKRANEK
jgi:hypothetical protein